MRDVVKFLMASLTLSHLYYIEGVGLVDTRNESSFLKTFMTC